MIRMDRYASATQICYVCVVLASPETRIHVAVAAAPFSFTIIRLLKYFFVEFWASKFRREIQLFEFHQQQICQQHYFGIHSWCWLLSNKDDISE